MNRPDLTSITSTLGSNKGGFQYIEYCPVEWLAEDPDVDPETLVVASALQLVPGKSMLRLKCMSDSIDFKEAVKESSAGTYFEQQCGAIVNLDDSEKSLQLDTLRLHRLVLVLPDKNNRTRILGNKTNGPRLGYELRIEAEVSGKSYYDLRFSGSSEHAAPFYQPV